MRDDSEEENTYVSKVWTKCVDACYSAVSQTHIATLYCLGSGSLLA